MKFSLHKVLLIAGILLTLVLLSTACSSKDNDEIFTDSYQRDSSQDQAAPDVTEIPAATGQPGGKDNSAVSDSNNTSDNASVENPLDITAADNSADNAEIGNPATNESGAVNSSDNSSSDSDDSGSGSDTSNQGKEGSNNSKDNPTDNTGDSSIDNGSIDSNSNTSDSKDNNTASVSNNTTQDKQITESGQTSDSSQVTDTASNTDGNVTTEGNSHVIVIDAGHQSKGNYDEEPIGPGSDITKPKVSSGTQGAFTGVPEYKLNLAVAKKVEKELIARGYKVIMIRKTNDVNISNKERAEIANKSGADLFIRIHADGSTNSSVNGTSTLYPSKDNSFVPELNKDSYSLAKSIVDAICDSTGGKNRGAIAHDDMSGINWCTIPVTIIEMGYMTNEKEDRLMQTEEYQNKIVQGICNGIDDYFN